MKRSILSKFIIAMNMVTFLWVSTIVHAGGGKDQDDNMEQDGGGELTPPPVTLPPPSVVPPPLVSDGEYPGAPIGKDHDDNMEQDDGVVTPPPPLPPAPPPYVEVPGDPQPMTQDNFIEASCQRLVERGRDFCLKAESDKSRDLALRACKSSYHMNMKNAEKEYNLAGKSVKERQRLFEKFHKTQQKNLEKGRISPNEKAYLEQEYYNIGHNNLTAEQHYKLCSNYARAAEYEAGKMLQYHIGDTKRDRDPQDFGVANLDRCQAWMDREIGAILAIDQVDPEIVGKYSKYNGKVKDTHKMMHEARALAEKCDAGKQEAGTVGAWMKKNKWLLLGLGALAIFAVLCWVTPVLSGLSFCKQKNRPPVKPPVVTPPGGGGGGGCRGPRCHPCRGPGCGGGGGGVTPVPGTFGSRTTATSTETGDSATGTYVDRGTSTVATGDSSTTGDFGGRGEVSSGTTDGSSSFDVRDDASTGQNVDSFGSRGDSVVPRE